jgi:hypothetical protein
MIKKKTKTGKPRSRLSAALHETASGMHRIGLIDTATMRKFDASCLMAAEPRSAMEREDEAGQRTGAPRKATEL